MCSGNLFIKIISDNKTQYYTLENNSDEIKVYCITNNLYITSIIKFYQNST